MGFFDSFLHNPVDALGGAIGDLFGGKPPDTSGMNASAVMSSETGKKALEAFLAELARTQGQRDQAAADASSISRAQIETMGSQNRLADEYATYNRETFRPLEMGIVQDAQGFDTPERRNQEASRAVADMAIQRDAARDASRRSLASFGVSPDSMKSQSLEASQDINFARGAAGTAQAARDRVEATGRALKLDAANLGRGLPSAQATAISTGTNAGNSAIGAGNAGVGAALSGMQGLQAGYGAAMQGYGQAGNLYGRVAGIDSATRGQNLDFVSSMYRSFMGS